MIDGSNGNLLVLFSLVVSILASYTTLVVATVSQHLLVVQPDGG